MTSMDAGGLESLAQRATNVGCRPAAGDYKGAQPPYLADKRTECAVSASCDKNVMYEMCQFCQENVFQMCTFFLAPVPHYRVPHYRITVPRQ